MAYIKICQRFKGLNNNFPRLLRYLYFQHSLKRQDRILMRQLLGLRASIHQLRGLCSYSQSASLASLTQEEEQRQGRQQGGGPSSGMGWASADDTLCGPVTDSPTREQDVMLSFQNRTMSLVSVHREYPDSAFKLVQFNHSQEFFL